MIATGRRVLVGVFGGAIVLGLGTMPDASARHRRCIECEEPSIDDGSGFDDKGPSFDRLYRDIPFQWDDNGPPASDNPPLPQGVVLTVPVGADGRTKLGPAPATLERYAAVAAALGECWVAPSADNDHWGEITLRVSFKRDGSVNGIPRVIYPAGSADAGKAAGLKSSLLGALSHCAPLHVSPSLGNAIAGQIFAISFIQQGH